MKHDEILNKLPGTLANEPMSKHCTYRIGGPAKYYYAAKTTDQFVQAVRLARENKIPLFILGKGSNILVSDKGFAGLVLHNEVTERSQEGDEVKVTAGASLVEFSLWTISQGLAGLEFSSGIPGSVGGGIRGNAGAFGSEMKDYINNVLVLTPESEVKEFGNEECQFGYRDSIFKHSDNLVLEATFGLKPGNKKESLALVKQFNEQRRSKQDYSIPSAGCTFKNIPGNPAAKMIDELGLKGTRIGDAMISNTHANFIVNVGEARASDVLELIGMIQQKVKDKYNIDLETEIQMVGF